MHAILKSGALMVALALVGTPALAAPRDHDRGHDRDRNGHYDRGDRHDRRAAYRHGYREGRRDERRDDRRVAYREYHRPRVVYHRPHYYAPRPVVIHRGPPRWARGARYYAPGYGRTYVVSDYYEYGLRSPPSGHYWRRSDAGDFLLVAAATGIIADLILHH